MITGKVENETVWISYKTWRRLTERGGGGRGPRPLYVRAGVPAGKEWVYFAWVSAGRGRLKLAEIEAKDLYWTATAAVHADALDEIEEMEALAGLIARAASAKRSGFFARVWRMAAAFAFPAKNTGRANLLRQKRPVDQGAAFPCRPSGRFL